MAHISERVPASLKRSLSLDSAKAKEKLPEDTAITARDLTDDVEVAHGSEEKQSLGLYPKLRPYILTALALLILGWWISATVLKATRHRWYALYVPPLRPSYL
jgi:CNT family concentrative nucleoside transporter